MVEGSKQVRVDNWGVFFLQRLQMFFSKTDYCDLTLQFEGNVQLKVHRLVMNACTEYFTILEQNYPAVEENTIMMPGDLQSDVIVPIVNFMYTGMLEFHMSIFEKLYSAAELMNITILTKLLDAQRTAYQQHRLKQKPEPKPKPEAATWARKPLQKEKAPDLPPGRRVPAWKRKPTSTAHPVSQLHFPEQRYPMDPLSIPDNTPKPTRFEWPDEDLPAFNFLDSSFEEVSLTSRPLLTKEDEDKAKPSFDDLRYNVEVPKKRGGGSRASSSGVNTAEVEEFVKEQKIRSAMFEDVESCEGGGQKRKLQQATPKQPPKKARANDKENQETTISVEGNDLTDMANIDHTKIVAEILKKYPDLVKRNKNIKLKIMTSGNNKNSPEKVAAQPVVEKAKKPPVQVEPVKVKQNNSTTPKKSPKKKEAPEEGPWVCRKCVAMGVEPQEFVLYYLYRKHMTDTHNEIFDAKLCKYCGKRCGTDNLMMYHLYTKHALKPPSSYNFPKCDRCPFIAQSASRLDRHQSVHKPSEMQCQDCKLAFAGPNALGAHVRVTGHYNKPGRISFDCQYCMKKLQSAIGLFAHLRNAHAREAKRDGIVCLDELDAMEELDVGEEEEEVVVGEEEEEVRDEYIVPEVLPESVTQKDKVKIISNVKVPAARAGPPTEGAAQVIRLDPSSEAESLTNVASGIATSLGLVDIVVLDDNRQYILQQQDGRDEQEFIIPDLRPGQSFARQVITTQHNAVLQQGMIQSAGSDIGSTDELVMVLTDHEYAEDHEGDHSDNSNIVVLYSHPVEGQEGQFITSQGNLLVNSQTGMLEIRNGTGIATSSAGQVVAAEDDDDPVESIEMIHREIHGTSADLKQEPYYEQDGKQDVQFQQNTIPESQEEVEEEIQSEETVEESAPQENLENSDNKDDVPEEDSQEKEKESDDIVDGNEETEEPMEIEEIEDNESAKVNQNEAHEQVYAVQDSSATGTESEANENVEEETVCDDEEETAPTQEEGQDVVPEKATNEVTEETELVINDPAIVSNYSSENVIEEEATERMEVDGKIAERKNEESPEVTEEVDATSVEEQMEQTQPEETQPESEKPQTEPEESQTEHEETQTEHEETQTEPEESQTEREETQTEPEQTQTEPEETQTGLEETQTEPEETHAELEETQAEPEEATPEDQPEQTQDEDAGNEDKGKAPEDGGETTLEANDLREETKRKQAEINKTILDDWEEEDTDSQQSGKQTQEESEEAKHCHSQDEDENQTRAVENVNKLMDDWEEEDEEDKKDAE